MHRRSGESLQGWVTRRASHEEEPPTPREPAPTPDEIIAMLREYDAAGGVASKPSKLPTPWPPPESLSSARSPRRPETRSGNAFAQLLDASLPKVVFLPSDASQREMRVPVEPVLPREAAPDPSQHKARRKYLVHLQKQYEKLIKGQPNAPSSDPARLVVLQHAYPNDGAATILMMSRYLEALGKYRRADAEQQMRERDAALLRALDENGDGKIQCACYASYSDRILSARTY